MVLLFDKEVEGRKLQWQGGELCQKMHITQSSKPISNVDKEYIDKHESHNEILQCDSDEASVESEENDNEESPNLRRMFEKSNENSFLNNTFIKVWLGRKV